MNLYDIAREVTDEVLGKGTYAGVNGGNPNPNPQFRKAVRDSCQHEYIDSNDASEPETNVSVCIHCGATS